VVKYDGEKRVRKVQMELDSRPRTGCVMSKVRRKGKTLGGGRQCTCKVTLRSGRGTIVAVEKQ
jgi:hypothetical protein